MGDGKVCAPTEARSVCTMYHRQLALSTTWSRAERQHMRYAGRNADVFASVKPMRLLRERTAL